jgi:hypothetical protein
MVEMRSVTRHPYHQTNLYSFLALAKKYLGAKVDDETITTVKNIPRANTPSPQETSEQIEALASLLATVQNQNLGLGRWGDKFPGINLAGAAGESYLAKHGIENPLNSVGVGMAANHPGLSFFPSNTPGMLDILGSQEGQQRAFLDSLYRWPSQPRPHGTTAAEQSDPHKAPAKKALPKKAAAKKTPAKKASPAVKASEGKNTRRAK